MTPKEFLMLGKAQLEQSRLHFSDSLQHMEQLFLRTLNWDKTHLLLKSNDKLLEEEIRQLEEVLGRRLRGEPLQYILGFEYFYNSKFQVGSGCLIPRKETELLVDEILSYAPGRNLRIAELGAGSGNIGISVLQKRSQYEWHAFEINPDSVFYAKKNIQTLLPKTHSYFLHEGDFFERAKEWGPYDLIISNPPYLSVQEMSEIPGEVKWEPVEALLAGPEGLDVILKLVDVGPLLVNPGGALFCEMSSSQEENLRKALTNRGHHSFDILPDLAGLPRMVRLYFR